LTPFELLGHPDTGAAALSGEARGSVAALDKVLCTSNEVPPGVRLVLEHSGTMPFFAVFSAATHMCDCDHLAAFVSR